MPAWTLLAGGDRRFDSNHPEGLRRLRDSIGNLLQVKNLSVLLGAGASFHLGLPAIRSVSLDDLKEMLSDAGESLTGEEESLLEKLLDGKDGDLEAVLGGLSASISYAEVWDVLSLPGGTGEIDPSVIRELRAKLNFSIARACELSEGSAADSSLAHREFFRKILSSRRGELPRVKVFTTNYDLAIEHALDRLGVPYFDGFVGSLRRRMRLESYGLDLYFHSGIERPRRVPRALQLYKVHGSLNWVAHPSSAGTREVIQTNQAPTRDNLALIYPTPYKESDALGYPYADLLRVFSTSVSDSQSGLLVIGYGFADEHLNRLIYQALAANPSLSVFIVSPRDVLVDDGGEKVTFHSSRLGLIAALPDARISALTGESSTFEFFSGEMLPDPETPVEEAWQEGKLEDALLGETKEVGESQS